MNMNDNEFMRQQQAAVERMKEMSSRAAPVSTGQRMPPVPSFVKVPQNGRNGSGQHSGQNAADSRRGGNAQRQETRGNAGSSAASNTSAVQKNGSSGGFLSGLDLPFLDIFSKDTDVALIIGLLLILMSEKADKKLLFALVYILMR